MKSFSVKKKIASKTKLIKMLIKLNLASNKTLAGYMFMTYMP